MTRSLSWRWDQTARLLRSHADVIDARPHTDTPEALARRGWSDWLLALDGPALDAIEGGGPWPDGAPSSLIELVRTAHEACELPALSSSSSSSSSASSVRRHETPRKQAQIDAFAQLVVPLAARATRVLDVGSGHGHLTRELADRIGPPVIGLERDPRLADRARALAQDRASFALVDVVDDALALRPTDLLIGLHACGELGDALVSRAGAAGASVVLVGCCLQKRRGDERRSFVDDALVLRKATLGLSNLTPRDVGVEATRAENLVARERRLAVHRLLAQAGVTVELGAELRGLNRRAAHQPLGDVVDRAFALRGLAIPVAAEIDDAAQWARAAHQRLRRLALPRHALARVLEVFVLVDRARALEQRGYVVDVGPAFSQELSARNLALVATPSSR